MLSIIIVNYKNPPLLRLCLKSIKRVLPSEFSHEIIVIDVAAILQTEHVVTEEFSDVRYIPFKKNIGYTKGVNEGIKQSKGDMVCIMNPDIIPLPGALEHMYQYMKENPKIGILGPQLLNFDGSPQQSCFRFYTPMTIVCRRTFIGRFPSSQKILNRFALKDKDLNKPTSVDWLMGSSLMVSKKAIEKVGLMDEHLFLYMSDVDWPRQFWENGYQVVFYPYAAMYHYHRRESRGKLSILDIFFNQQTHWHLRDAIYYFKKYGLQSISYVV